MYKKIRRAIIRSNILETQFKFDIGLQFDKIEISLFGFGIGVINAIFQQFGKYETAIK